MNSNVYDTDLYHTSCIRAHTRTHACARARAHTHTHTHTQWLAETGCWYWLGQKEEGFQFGFKRCHNWAAAKVLWEWIPNVGPKAREGAKARSVYIIRFSACGYVYIIFICITHMLKIQQYKHKTHVMAFTPSLALDQYIYIYIYVCVCRERV